MPNDWELPVEVEPDAASTRDESGPFQNTPSHRFVVSVVGAVWAFCGVVSMPQLMQQPWNLSLISAWQLAVCAAVMGCCMCVWGVSAADWAARIAQWAGNHVALLLSMIALPAVIDFVLKHL